MGNPESDIRTPIALCLEKLGATEDERYTRCTARSGREQGLAIGLGGAILWCSPEPAACTLWVSRDQRLMALRPEGAPTVSVVRAGRTLELPADKPVVLRHQDDLVFAGVRYRVHVTCALATLCGGGCRTDNLLFAGDADTPPCGPWRVRILSELLAENRISCLEWSLPQLAGEARARGLDAPDFARTVQISRHARE